MNQCNSITFFLLALAAQAICVFTNFAAAFTLPPTNDNARHMKWPFSTRDSRETIKNLSHRTQFPRLSSNKVSGHGANQKRLHANEKKMSRNDEDNEINRTYDNLGPLMPLAKKLDEVSGEWALSYADLSPATPKTPAGVAFLATNICYAGAGLALGLQGEYLLGILTEIAGIVSFWYHYSQLELGQDRSEVRLALLTDYITASAALLTGGFYIAQMDISILPLEIVGFSIASVLSLALCWVWEFGYPYLILHSLWHILSAYTGYLVGQAHLMSIA